MTTTRHRRHIYGPVPSRRLGRSLGVDLVPLKTCSYDCVYCQLGRTRTTTIDRRIDVPIREVLGELQQKLASGDDPDWISVAGSGEPTLHAGIGTLIRGIKAMTPVPVAVLTNGSLLWRPDVQHDLMEADLVLPSLDAGDEHLFQRVNRPHAGIAFMPMVEGLATFTARFAGEVWLEVFLLEGLTGIPVEVEKIAGLARHIGPARIQLNTVTRPPAQSFARPVPAQALADLAAHFSGRVDVICDGVRSRAPVGALSPDTAEDILALLRRRPCTTADVATGLGLPLLEVLKYLDGLVVAGTLSPTLADGRCFYTVTDPDGAALPTGSGS